MVRYYQASVLCEADRVGVDLPPTNLQLVDVNDVVQLVCCTTWCSCSWHLWALCVCTCVQCVGVYMGVSVCVLGLSSSIGKAGWSTAGGDCRRDGAHCQGETAHVHTLQMHVCHVHISPHSPAWQRFFTWRRAGRTSLTTLSSCLMPEGGTWRRS